MNTSVGQMDQNDVWLAEAVEYQSSAKPPSHMNSSELRLSNNDLHVETDTDKCLAINTFTDRVHDRIVLPPSPTIAVQTAWYSEVVGTNSGLDTNGDEIGQFSNKALNATGVPPPLMGTIIRYEICCQYARHKVVCHQMELIASLYVSAFVLVEVVTKHTLENATILSEGDSSDDEEFTKYIRKRPKRFYFGCFILGITEENIEQATRSNCHMG